VDTPTLEALIDAQVRFTILAPEQVAAVRRPGKDWVAVNPTTVDTGRLYRFMHPDGSGRSIALAIFDGPVSRDLAFGSASRDAGTFLAAVRKAADRSSVEGPRLVLAASDGELYGHHKKFADLTLAWATQVAADSAGIEVTNLATFLQRRPPTWEARLHPGPGGEGTAWSCSHGVGRWRRDCGCAMDTSRGWNQAWRGPLREAFDCLRDRAAVFFAEAAPMPEGKQAHFSCVQPWVWAYPWPHFGLSLAPLLGACSVTTRGGAGQRSRPRRGRTCPKARAVVVGARRCGAGLRSGFQGGPESCVWRPAR
jgi:hypothetical protein